MLHFMSSPVATAFALLLILSVVRANNDCNDIGLSDFDCTSYDPNACYNNMCIPERQRQQSKFEPCKTNICFLLKQEAPIVIIPNDRQSRQSISVPFKCNESKERGVSGSLTDLFTTSTAGEQYCVWVGDNTQCTWNMIQHLVASDDEYMFAAGGPMLETPQRKCHHVPSSSWLDDRMVVVGNSTSAPNEHPWLIVTFPFSRNAWWWFAGILFAHIVVFAFLAWRVHHRLHYKLAATYFLLTGDEGNILESKFFNEGLQQRTQEETGRINRLTIVASVFRFSLKMAFLVFLVFYEAGLVNLLFFQDNSAVSNRAVGSISRGKLPKYCVMKDSALANVWRNRVDPSNEVGENDELRWREEDGLLSCIHRIIDVNDEVRFAVSYEIEAKFQIEKHNKENGDSGTRLQIFELQDDIYRFNSGWLFKKPENELQRKRLAEMNIHLVQSRVNGSLEEWLGGGETPKQRNKVTAQVLAITFTLFVYVPLLIVLLLLILWGRLELNWHWNFWCWAQGRRKKNRRGDEEHGNIAMASY